jgi:hypothetical protein
MDFLWWTAYPTSKVDPKVVDKSIQHQKIEKIAKKYEKYILTCCHVSSSFLDEVLACKLCTDLIINDFEGVSFPSTVSTKKLLISIPCSFLEAKPTGKAQMNDIEGMWAKRGSAKCEDSP